MSGIYIHIPFCLNKCPYCDFYSVSVCKDISLISDFVKSLKCEITNSASIFGDQIISSVYFGGGTPSVLSPQILSDIFLTVKSNYNLSESREVTLEINPEHATDKYFSELRDLNFVNRLSTGFQAMHSSGLSYLQRRHSVDDNINFIDLSQRYGFNNFSVDYIYGYSSLENYDIESAFEFFISRRIPHISAYSLGIEKNTKFYSMLKHGQISKISDDQCFEQFSLIHNLLTFSGYQHYEISNFSLPGKESFHNSSYWNLTPYLGFGPSAHSYFNNSRRWNIRNVSKYIEFVNNGNCVFESEMLSHSDNYNEYIMIRLRTFKGLSITYVKENFTDFYNSFQNTLSRRDLKEYFVTDGDFVSLTLKGMFISDFIISEFFV